MFEDMEVISRYAVFYGRWLQCVDAETSVNCGELDHAI